MKLSRYNEYLLALVGTGVLAMFGFGVVQSLLRRLPDREPAVEVLSTAATGVRVDAKSQQLQVSYCELEQVAGSQIRYLTVAIRNVLDPDADVSIYGLTDEAENPYGLSQLWSSNSVWDDSSGYARANKWGYCGGPKLNVIVWNPEDGSQHLLLEKSRPIGIFRTPDADCADGKGSMPCDRIVFTSYPRDTNGDGRIGYDDDEILFVSDLKGQKMVEVTPPGATILDFGWIASDDTLWLRVRRDSNRNKKIDDQDETGYMRTSYRTPTVPQPMIDPAIRGELEKLIAAPNAKN